MHIVYVGPVEFPSSSANAQRMAGVVRALATAGNRVSVGSASRGRWELEDSHFQGASVRQLSEAPDPGWGRLHRVWRSLSWGAATRDWIENMIPAPDVILLYGTSLGYLLRLIPLAHRLRIPLVLDAVEWYQSSHLPGGRFGIFAMANALSMRLASKADGAIVISRFLSKHFEDMGLPTTRVPPLFEIGLDPDPRNPGQSYSPLSLCYVGSPGKKDQQTLLNLVQLPGELNATAKDLTIDIVGLDMRAATSLLGAATLHALSGECLRFHGRLSTVNARQVISNSHFSVLQRGPERYARAGFPSKIPESLLLGTPVMANLTSDLADFLVDGENAKILASSSLQSLVSAVGSTLSEDYGFDRKSIAAKAQVSFCPARYAKSLHDFLVVIHEGCRQPAR